MIWEQLLIGELKIEIGLPEKMGRYPAYFIHAANEEGKQIEGLLKYKEVLLVSITSSMENWQRHMSPWRAQALNKRMTDFTGEADDYIGELMEKVMPRVEGLVNKRGYEFDKKLIVGYSMGGLFACYMMTRSSYFQGAASISGSLWYDGFVAYMKKQIVSAETSWYFSLGDKEAHTKNERMRQVEDCTREILAAIKLQGSTSFFELNRGGHFEDVSLRIARGIDYLTSGNDLFKSKAETNST